MMKQKIVVFVASMVFVLVVSCSESNQEVKEAESVSVEVMEDTSSVFSETLVQTENTDTQIENVQSQAESTKIETETGSTKKQAEYIKITPEQAEDMMKEDVVILDVRTLEEFEAGHIQDAVLLPDYDIKEKAEDVLKDKNQTILVYCRSGRRSEAAAKELVQMGYMNVYDFGGIQDWTGDVVTDDSITVAPLQFSQRLL